MNPPFTSIHHVAHRTNQATLEATKNEFMSIVMDSILNTLIGWLLKKSSKRKFALQILQSELNDGHNSLNRYSIIH